MSDISIFKEQVIPDVSGLSALLQSLLKIDSRTEYPGIEEVMALMKNYCIQSGLEYTVTGPDNGPSSLIVINQGKKAGRDRLILLSHIDTHGWDRENWSVHPLSGKIINKKIYGRGAIDCKSLTAIWLHLMKCLIRYTPERDIVLIITSDEETGGDAGLKWIADNTELLKGCSCAINEGGGYIIPTSTGKTAITCQYGEKGKIEYSLDSGKNAKEKLIRDRGIKGILRHLRSKRQYKISMNKFNGCRIKPDFKNSFFNSITVQNYIAYVNYLPNVDPGKLIGLLQNERFLITGQKEVKKVEATVSSLKTKLFCIIQNFTEKLDLDIVPVITRGYSDARYLRSLGIDTYGFFPIGRREDILRIHGTDEFIHEESLHEAFQILFRIVCHYTNLELSILSDKKDE